MCPLTIRGPLSSNQASLSCLVFLTDAGHKQRHGVWMETELQGEKEQDSKGNKNGIYISVDPQLHILKFIGNYFSIE